ncbi:MAG: Amuc_1100 family pilus-like protein [Verrucomicrobiota bacterium]
MNARWFRDNLSVVIFSVIFVGFLGGIIWFLRTAYAEQATVLQELEAQQGELHRFQDGKPYPSDENISVLKRDHTQIKRLYGLMQNAAIRDVIHPPDLERDMDFAQLMRSTVGRLTDTATSNNVKIDPTFAWGFSRYIATIPCKNPAAKGDDCKRLLRLLAKQLLIVEKLSGALITSKVESIGAIRRTEVEPGSSGDTLSAPITDDAKSLYRTYPFELAFTADTDALRSLLNSLAQADNLYIVRSVKITVVTQQVRAPSAPVSPPTPDSVDIEVKMPDVPKTIERRLLNVTVRVDVVEFKPIETKPVKH